MNEFGELPKFSRPPTNEEKSYYLSYSAVYNHDTGEVEITKQPTAKHRFYLAEAPTDELFAEFIAQNSGSVTVVKNWDTNRLERVRFRS